jgi:hypothetical protein
LAPKDGQVSAAAANAWATPSGDTFTEMNSHSGTSEVQHQLGPSPFGHYAVQLPGDGLDGLPDQDLLIGEANQRHMAKLLHFEVTAV